MLSRLVPQGEHKTPENAQQFGSYELPTGSGAIHLWVSVERTRPGRERVGQC